MKIIGIIPARMGSSRFPGKPLADILGKAMIYHVYWRSKMARCMDDVYVATCDKQIEDYCRDNGMNVVMTKDTHQRASDRTAEAMLKIEKSKRGKMDIVVMIQGDEPMVFPGMITQAVKPMLNDKRIDVVNLMASIDSEEDRSDANEVKVVADLDGFALYFSREPIPSAKKTSGRIFTYKQVCIIPFRRDFLLKFNNLTQTPLEEAESIDMLRVLEHGYKVKMVLTKEETYSVDVKEDLLFVEEAMKHDKLLKRYYKSDKP